MSKLSIEAKQAIVEKVLSRDGRTVKEIAETHNVGYSTLQKRDMGSGHNTLCHNTLLTYIN